MMKVFKMRRMLKEEDAMATFFCNWCMPMSWMTLGSTLMTMNGFLMGFTSKMYGLCLGV